MLMKGKRRSSTTRRSYDPSRDRQDLCRLLAEYARIVEAFNDHRSLLRGSFQRLVRRCGKKRCRCRRGSLHESRVFVEREGRRRRVHRTTIAEEAALRKPLRRYQELRRLRARLSKIHAEVLSLCDRLREHRLEEGRRILSRWRKKRRA